MNEYFINKKSKKIKTHTHKKFKNQNCILQKKKKKGLNVAEWRAKRKRQHVQSRSLWMLVVQIFIQNVWPLFSFTFNSVFTLVFSPFQRDKFWVNLGGNYMAPFKKFLFPPPYQTTYKLIFFSIFSKGVNLVLETVPIWLVKQYILIPVYTGVPFWVYHYFLYL